MQFIYSITNTKNSKSYIGKTKNKINLRWNQHKSELNNNKSNCKYLQNAWNKYGEESFIFEILAEGYFTEDELANLEEIFIKLYGHYNILTTSNINHFSKARRNKLSKMLSRRNKERWQDDNYKNYMSNISKENWKNIEYRNKITKAISKRQKQLWKDPDYKNKIRESKKTEDWQYFEAVKDFWRYKHNGDGGYKHPGPNIIIKTFPISIHSAKLFIEEYKQDQTIQVIEGYNEQDIFDYWNNSANATDKRFKHPGRKKISKHFGLSELLVDKLLKKFKTYG